MAKGLGEDYENREKRSVEAAKRAVKKNLSARQKIHGFFADLYESPVYSEYYSFSTNDSVGSKLMLAHASVQYPRLAGLLQKERIASIAGKFDTVAIDGIAMNVNDAAPWGSAFFDQIMKLTACQAAYEDKEIAGDVEKGLVKALEMADVSKILGVPKLKLNLGKCETASLEETITTVDKTHGFELVFSGFGFIKKKDVEEKGYFGKKGKFLFNIRPGMGVVGFESSGPHSNGYTALRLRLLNGKFEKRKEYSKEYTGRFSLDDKVPDDGRTFLEVLLEPTKIYSMVMAAISKELPYVIGINITGNGLRNFNRAGENIKYFIYDPIEPQPIFRVFEEEVERQFRDGKIKEKDKYGTEKLYTKLNMGMGFACLVNLSDVPKVLDIAEKFDIKAKDIGIVIGSREKEASVILKKGKNDYIFKGY